MRACAYMCAYDNLLKSSELIGQSDTRCVEHCPLPPQSRSGEINMLETLCQVIRH